MNPNAITGFPGFRKKPEPQEPQAEFLPAEDPQAPDPIAQHLEQLMVQAQALQELFPQFSLEVELENPVFARMTAPGMDIPLEDAYFAVHRRELQEAIMTLAAEKTAEKLAASMEALAARPRENGLGGQSAPITHPSYNPADPQQRKAIKARVYAGERVVL